MNMQHSLILEIMLYEFKLEHNHQSLKKKNLFSEKWKSSSSQSNNQMAEELFPRLQEIWRSGKIREDSTMDSEAVLQIIE